MKIYKLYLLMVAIIFVLSFFISGVKREPVEKLSIASAIGYDLEKNLEGIEIRSATATRYVVTGKQVKTLNITTTGETIPDLREKRQRRIDKKILVGLEKVYVIGENFAKHGIREIMDIYFRNPDVKDSTLVCVCEGKAEDMLNVKVEGYPSAGDYIEGLLRYAGEMNFYSNNYMLIDSYIRLDEEGRSLALPYIRVTDNIIEIAGMAIFKDDKMISVVSNEKAKYLNLLRESNVKGNIVIQKDSDSYIGIYADSKRKVKCHKENDKYKFIIDLNISGQIVANEYDPSIISTPEKKKEIEAQFADQLKEELELFIRKLKTEHRVDSLELGRIAVAKYGRDTGVDWDEIVSDSEILVNVKCRIKRFGRGDF